MTSSSRCLHCKIDQLKRMQTEKAGLALERQVKTVFLPRERKLVQKCLGTPSKDGLYHPVSDFYRGRET